jgi:hypothetical protein
MEELQGLLELNKSEGIYIDIGTQIYLEIDGVDFSVSSIFVGLLKDEFMIITLPKKFKSVKNKLYPGSRMVVKYLFNGSVYAFQTSVMEIIDKPIRAIALEYPRVVQKRELRGSKRNIVVIPSRVEARKTDFYVVVFDISKHGCRFKYTDDKFKKPALRPGDSLNLHCKFPGVADENLVKAKVMNVSRTQGQLSIGVEFIDIGKNFLTYLMHFLFSIEDFS